MTRKIFLFCPAFDSGGVERNAVFFANSMQEKGYSVIVIYARKTDRWFNRINQSIDRLQIKNHIKIPFINSRINDAINMALFLPIKLRKQADKSSVIFAFQSNVIAIIIAKIIGIKTVVRLSNHYKSATVEKNILRSASERLKRFFYRFSDSIVANSDELAMDYEKILKRKISIVYNPLPSLSGLSHVLQENIFVDKTRPIIISIGRLVLQKNFPLLINAFAIAQKSINACLVIIGEGSMRITLEKLIDDLDLTKSVFLLGQKDNIIDYLAHSDCFVLPSLYEGMPNALIEAVSVGIPAIAANIKTGPKEILLNGEGGYLVESNNAAAMASAIVEVVNNPNEAKRRAAIAKEAAIKRYSPENVISQYINAIESI